MKGFDFIKIESVNVVCPGFPSHHAGNAARRAGVGMRCRCFFECSLWSRFQFALCKFYVTHLLNEGIKYACPSWFINEMDHLPKHLRKRGALTFSAGKHTHKNVIINTWLFREGRRWSENPQTNKILAAPFPVCAWEWRWEWCVATRLWIETSLVVPSRINFFDLMLFSFPYFPHILLLID